VSRPRAQPTVPVSVQVTPEQWERWSRLARVDDRSMAGWIRRACDQVAAEQEAAAMAQEMIRRVEANAARRREKKIEAGRRYREGHREQVNESIRRYRSGYRVGVSVGDLRKIAKAVRTLKERKGTGT
jgi:predicted DNA-binding protein